MKNILKFCILAILPILCYAQPLPTITGKDYTTPGTASFYPSGVWHKNMELKCNVNFDYKPSNEFLDLRNVNTMSGNTVTNTYKLLASAIEPVYIASHPILDNDYKRASYLKFYNVTHVPSGIPNVLNIRVRNYNSGNLNTSSYYPLAFAVMYQNPSDNHTYCVTMHRGKGAKFTVKDVEIPPVNPGDQPTHIYTYSKALIIDLTEAMNLVATNGGNPDIIIGDVKDRNSVFSIANPTNLKSNVYIGYIDFKEELVNTHTLGFDNPSGILAMTSLDIHPGVLPATDPQTIDRKSYIDLLYFRDIDLHANYTSTTNFVVPTRISESGINNGLIELKVPPKNDPITGETNKTNFPFNAHETHLHRAVTFDNNGVATYNDNELYVNVACFGGADGVRKDGSGNYTWDGVEGGVVVMKVNLTTSGRVLTSSSSSAFQWFNYHPDADSPTTKLSPNNMTARSCHTAESIHIDQNNHFFVTTDERVTGATKLLNYSGTTPVYDVAHNADNAVNGSNNYIAGTPNTHGVYSSGGTVLSSTQKNETKIGSYLRVWGADETHSRLIGAGDDHHDASFVSDPYQAVGGPLGAYNTPEKSVANYLADTRRSELQPSDITATNASTVNTDYGLNSCHHIRTLYGTSNKLPADEINLSASGNITEESYPIRREAFLANYSQGVRVIDFKNFLNTSHTNNPTAKEIRERAYFDYIPTLNSDITSRYFYRNVADYDDDYHLTPNYYKNVIPFDDPNYYVGAWDAIPDRNVNSSDTRYESDENYIFAQTLNGNQAPWCPNGGFLVLRYFRDELGGVISGNTPSGADNGPNMAFSEVNLQGKFTLMRDLTVASSATVTLMPGRESDAHHSATMSITNQVVGGIPENNVIYVDGTLNIGTQEIRDQNGTLVQNEGDNLGTRIDVNVPIIVRSGGKLILHPIRTDKSKPINLSMVTIEKGGYLEIRPGTYVNFDGYNTDFQVGLVSYGNSVIKGGTTPQTRILICGRSKNFEIEDANYKNTKRRFLYFYDNNIDTNLNTINIINSDFKMAYVWSSPKLFSNSNPINNCSFIDSSYGVNGDVVQRLIHNYPMLQIGYSNVYSNNHATKSDVYLNSCTFSDILVTLPNSSNIYYRIGLDVNWLTNLTMNSCSFSKLNYGIVSQYNKYCDISSCTFNQGYTGFWDRYSQNRLCTNFSEKIARPILLTSSLSSALRGNELNKSEVAIWLEGSNDVYVKGNLLENFFNGIHIDNTTARLVGPPSGYCSPGVDEVYKAGRNYFANETSTGNPYIRNSSDPKISDIYFNEDRAKAQLKCGYNNFTSGSTRLHLYYNRGGSSLTSLPVGCDINKWNYTTGTCQIKQSNITPYYTGSICTSDTRANTCSISQKECACAYYYTFPYPLPFPQGFQLTHNLDLRLNEIHDISPNSLKIDTLFYSIKSFVDTFNINGSEKLNLIQNTLVQAAIVGDSTKYKLNVLKPYIWNSFNDTSNNSSNKLSTLYRLQGIFEWEQNLDSLAIVNNLILANAYTKRDTIMVDWSTKRNAIPLIDSTLSNLNTVDSLRQIYFNQVFDDIAIQYDTAGYALKQALVEKAESSSEKAEELIVSPNPFNNKLTIKINLKERSKVDVKLISADGKEVANILTDTLNAGTKEITKDVTQIESGVYYLLVKINDKEITKKMIKE